MSYLTLKNLFFMFTPYMDYKEFQVFNVGFQNHDNIPPNYSYRIQNDWTIHYVFHGSGTVFLNDKKIEVKAKQFFILPPYTPIKYYKNSDDPWIYFWFYFNGPNVDNIKKLTSFSNDNFVLNASSPVNTEEVILTLLNNLQSGNYNYLTVLSAFYSIISHIIPSRDKHSFLYESDICERVKETIRLNYSNPDFNVKTISEVLHISHSYLCKIFKQQENTTVVSFLKNYRLEQAKNILLTNELLNKELCYSVGFNDEIHFMKEFKNKFGISIKKYKQIYSK